MRSACLIFAFGVSLWLNNISAQDPSLAELVHQFLRSDLTGGGTRDTLVWQAGDSATLALLAQIHLPLGEHLARPSKDELQCPGGSDRADRPIPAPVGYVVRATITTDSGHTKLLLVVSCDFTYLGEPGPFLQGAEWEVAHFSTGWRAVKLLSSWIT
jgi:hypothetical protein